MLPAGLVLLLFVIWFWQHERTSQPKTEATPSSVPITVRTNTPKPTYANAQPTMPSHEILFPVDANGTVAIPAQFQLPGVTRAKSGYSSREWLAQYPADQQEKIQAFNKQHFGIYSINSPQQVAWMAQFGYPMPEDIIAAEHISDADLRALWKQGNDKAGFLLQERNAIAVKAAQDTNRAQGKSDEDFWNTNPTISQDDRDGMDLMRRSHSPYKGYVQASISLLGEDQLVKDSQIIAGLKWAERLGDFRANRFGETYAGNDPIRSAMWFGAGGVSTTAAFDSMLMRSTGCQNPGVPPDMAIPTGDNFHVE